jgi:Ca2+-binding RTX toxin-like protein
MAIGGNDRIEGGFGNDNLFGGDGDDIITDMGRPPTSFTRRRQRRRF